MNNTYYHETLGPQELVRVRHEGNNLWVILDTDKLGVSTIQNHKGMRRINHSELIPRQTFIEFQNQIPND